MVRGVWGTEGWRDLERVLGEGLVSGKVGEKI